MVHLKIAKEDKEGRLAPLCSPFCPGSRCLLWALYRRRHLGNSLIHHLSFPREESLNDFIPGELCCVQYTAFEQAVQMVKCCGSGAELVKYNIKSAFCLLLVHPDGFDLLRFL